LGLRSVPQNDLRAKSLKPVVRRMGRLDLSLLSELVPNFKEREVFTCGPQGYMDAIKSLLKQGGFDFQHYHQESSFFWFLRFQSWLILKGVG
jgi:ferredoxin-NADP reductase